MKTLSQFLTEANYDPDVQGRSRIQQTGAGGRMQPKAPTADRRGPGAEPRKKAIGGGKMVPVGPYKDRKDIGAPQPRSKKEEQPTQERGSAALSAREQQRKAYLERKARERGGQRAPITAKSKEKAATELLKTKKAEPQKTKSPKARRSWKTAEGGGMTRQERDAARNQETGKNRKDVKSQLRADFKKKHGRNPNKKEAIQITAKAHAAAKALK